MGDSGLVQSAWRRGTSRLGLRLCGETGAPSCICVRGQFLHPPTQAIALVPDRPAVADSREWLDFAQSVAESSA